MALSEKLADQASQLVDELNEYGMIPDHSPGSGPSVEEVWRKVASEGAEIDARLTEDRGGPGGSPRVLLSDEDSCIAITFDSGLGAWNIDPAQSQV
ncbi:MAG: hypothetical protein M0Z87_02460 [Actinomycetota bacterium]|nr:hypothetical protein [Actinomycetota bacterium]